MAHFPSGKTPNLVEKAKEEIEAIISSPAKETHGMRNDIDEKTSLDDVRAPNVFERAKEEIEALIQTIHPMKKDSSTHSTRDEERNDSHKQEKPISTSDTRVETPKFIEKAKEKLEQIIHPEKSPNHHHRETHGKNDDIDESTPIDEVKGPNVFERAKEEIEAVLQTILPKKNH